MQFMGLLRKSSEVGGGLYWLTHLFRVRPGYEEF